MPTGAADWTAVLDRRVAEGLAPGMVALVNRSGEVATHAAGYRDLRLRAPMQADTIFQLASVTKPIVAAAVMTLVDEGAVGLDEPVGRWLPELARPRVVRSRTGPLDDTVEAESEITLRQLLSMTFGHGMDFGGPSLVVERLRERGVFGQPLSTGAYLAALGATPLACQPGTRWLYHVGLDVAAMLAERVAQQPFDVFLRERLLAPLGMDDTAYDPGASNHERTATLYAEGGGGRFYEAPYRAPGAPVLPRGGSGLYSTVRDLGAFGRMMLNRGEYGGRRILSPDAVGEMTREQVDADAKRRSPVYPDFWESHGWGLGLCVVTAANAVSAVPGRFGWWGGTGTGLFMDPASDTVMVSLSQLHIRDISDSRNANAMMTAVLADGVAGRGRPPAAENPVGRRRDN